MSSPQLKKAVYVITTPLLVGGWALFIYALGWKAGLALFLIQTGLLVRAIHYVKHQARATLDDEN